MAHIPIFGDEASIPPRIGSLGFESVQIYEDDPGLGAGFRYAAEGNVKADTYLYDLSLPSIPKDLRSAEVVEWFQEACESIREMAERGKYLDLETRISPCLWMREGTNEPFCLWTSIAYRQAPGPQVAYSGRRVSHLALRTDRGYINKVRYSYPDTKAHEEPGGDEFLSFLAHWTSAVQQFPAMPIRG